MAQPSGPTAALAGVPTGLQAQGIWIGKRQLFVRFAAEAETATMYTATAIAQELKRTSARSVFHSISIGGRDPLSNLEFLDTALRHGPMPIPVMLDVDGQRPAGVAALTSHLALIQVTLEGATMEPLIERAMESIKVAAAAGVEHAVVLAPSEQTSDGQMLRAIEQVHQTSERTAVVIHPPLNTPIDRDRRWVALVEKASPLHTDVRLLLRLPQPTGTR